LLHSKERVRRKKWCSSSFLGLAGVEETLYTKSSDTINPHVDRMRVMQRFVDCSKFSKQDSKRNT